MGHMIYLEEMHNPKGQLSGVLLCDFSNMLARQTSLLQSWFFTYERTDMKQ